MAVADPDLQIRGEGGEGLKKHGSLGLSVV